MFLAGSICICSGPGSCASVLCNVSLRYFAQLKVGIITDHSGRLTPAGTGAIRVTVLSPPSLLELEFIGTRFRTDNGCETLLPMSRCRKSLPLPASVQRLKQE
jgi:hypothetical protein